MSALRPGSHCFVQYVGDALWHERVVLAWVQGGEYIILTHDGDIYIEELSAGNVDLDGLRFCAADGFIPYGLTGQQLYTFVPPPAGATLASVLAEGDRRHNGRGGAVLTRGWVP